MWERKGSAGSRAPKARAVGPTDSGAAARGGWTRPPKSVVRRIVALLVTGLAFYVVLPSLSAVLGSWPRLATLSGIWLFVAVLSEAASFVCNFGIERIVLGTRGWFGVVTAGLSGNAITNALPGGAAAGAAVQFRMLRTAGIDADAAVGGLTATSLLGVGGLLLLPILTLPAILGGAPVNHRLESAALLGVAGFVVYLALAVILLATDRPLRDVGKAAQWLWNKIRRPRPRLVGLEDRLLAQRDEIRRGLGRDWKQVLILVVGRLGFDYLCLLAALRATGSQPHVWLVLLAYSTAGVIGLVPITPGDLGVFEASLSGLLVLAGVNPSSAVVATLAYRLAQYWLPMVAGAIAYLLFRRRYGAA